MMRLLRSRLKSDSGFSLIELSVAMILSSMISASLIAVFYSFSQNSGDLAAKSNVQQSARAVISAQVIEIRQAIRADLNGEAVEAISADRLAFYTQNYVSGEIERIVYERTDCAEGECELWVYRYSMLSTDGIQTTFNTVPYDASFLMGNVLNDKPMFFGIRYVGDPLTKVETPSCDGASIDCDFPVIGITLRARPYPTSGGASTPVELHEEVRIRSV
jgi:prepilin-type N-terminal cleavage/methylation domain-containing protein